MFYDTSHHLELEIPPEILDFLKLFPHIYAGKWTSIYPCLRFKMTDSENPHDNIQDYQIMSPRDFIMTIVCALYTVVIFFLLLYALHK